MCKKVPTPPIRTSAAAERTAALILIVFGVLLVRLLNGARSLEETQWSRLLVLYNGVEAMAFAAAGLLLGTRVQRGQIDAAESRASALELSEKSALERAAGVEERGRALRVAVENITPRRSALEADDSSDVSLVSIARQLFPD